MTQILKPLIAIAMTSLGSSVASADANNANRDRGMQLGGAAINVGTGVLYMNIFEASCASYCHAFWALPLAAEALKMAQNQKDSSGQNGLAAMSLAGLDLSAFGPGATLGNGASNGLGSSFVIDGNSDGTGSTGGAGSGIDAGSFDKNALLNGQLTEKSVEAGIQKLRADLVKLGVSVSPDGTKIKTPDGRTFDTEKAKGKTGAAALQAMGMTPQEAQSALQASSQIAKAAEAQAAKLLAAAKQSSLSLDGDGGGTGGRGARAPAGANPNFDPMAMFRMKMGRDAAKPAAPAVSGLTKKVGDDSIGVAQDNIFEMITRRYRSRDQSGAFIKD